MEDRVEDTTRDNVGNIKDRADAALTSMTGLRAFLERKLAELNGMPLEGLKAADLAAIQRDLGKAVQLVVVEEGKVADALRKESGGDGFDFDAARLEVGRRLDRIRDTLGEGSIS